MPSETSAITRLAAWLGPRAAWLLWPRNPYLRGLLWASLASLLCILFVDRALVLFFYEHRAHWVYGFSHAITDIGKGNAWYILAVLALLAGWAGNRFALTVARALMWRRVRNAGLFLLGSLLLSGIALLALKVVFGRLRPRYLFENGTYNFDPFTFDTGMVGFSSGHTQTIFAVMTVLWLVLPQHRLLYLIVAVLVGFSRVVVGAHYLGDVIFASFLAVALTVWLNDRMVRAGLPSRLQRGGHVLPFFRRRRRRRSG